MIRALLFMLRDGSGSPFFGGCWGLVTGSGTTCPCVLRWPCALSCTGSVCVLWCQITVDT